MPQTILITGASSGIGRATARLFAERGWNVAATARTPQTLADLRTSDGRVRTYELDVTDALSVASACALIETDFGGIDVLLNNAGYGLFGPFETATESQIEKQFETNLFGAFRVTRHALPLLRASGGGTVINITSIGGLVAFPLNSLYHATKFALDGFSESLRYELAPQGIRVKVVAPGGVKTDFATRSLALTYDGDGGTYRPLIDTVQAAFRARAEGDAATYSEPEAIAAVIWEAATDGTDRLRYLAGADAQATYEAWKGASNEDFARAVSLRFGLEGPAAPHQ